VRGQSPSWAEQGEEALVDPLLRFEISATKVIRLRPLHVAFVRHVGPYESVPESIFEELEQWAARRRLTGPPVWMGIGHDAPVTTPPEQLRFDSAPRSPDHSLRRVALVTSFCPAAISPLPPTPDHMRLCRPPIPPSSPASWPFPITRSSAYQ
jgi:hypothetical protein